MLLTLCSKDYTEILSKKKKNKGRMFLRASFMQNVNIIIDTTYIQICPANLHLFYITPMVNFLFIYYEKECITFISILNVENSTLCQIIHEVLIFEVTLIRRRVKSVKNLTQKYRS